MHRRDSSNIGFGNRPGKSGRRQIRRAFSLVEVMAALTLTAFVAAVGARQLIPTIAAATRTTVSARTIAMELNRLREQAILEGVPHGWRLQRRRGRVVSLEAFRRNAMNVPVRINNVVTLPAHVGMETDVRLIEFNPDGSAARQYRFQFTSGDEIATVEVVQVTGTVRLWEHNRRDVD